MDGAQTSRVRFEEGAVAVRRHGRDSVRADPEAESPQRFDERLLDRDRPAGAAALARVGAEIPGVDAEAPDGHVRSVWLSAADCQSVDSVPNRESDYKADRRIAPIQGFPEHFRAGVQAYLLLCRVAPNVG
jgi:hypothetical protein